MATTKDFKELGQLYRIALERDREAQARARDLYACYLPLARGSLYDNPYQEPLVDAVLKDRGVFAPGASIGPVEYDYATDTVTIMGKRFTRKELEDYGPGTMAEKILAALRASKPQEPQKPEDPVAARFAALDFDD